MYLFSYLQRRPQRTAFLDESEGQCLKHRCFHSQRQNLLFFFLYNKQMLLLVPRRWWSALGSMVTLVPPNRQVKKWSVLMHFCLGINLLSLQGWNPRALNAMLWLFVVKCGLAFLFVILANMRSSSRLFLHVKWTQKKYCILQNLDYVYVYRT